MLGLLILRKSGARAWNRAKSDVRIQASLWCLGDFWFFEIWASMIRPTWGRTHNGRPAKIQRFIPLSGFVWELMSPLDVRVPTEIEIEGAQKFNGIRYSETPGISLLYKHIWFLTEKRANAVNSMRTDIWFFLWWTTQTSLKFVFSAWFRIIA